MFNDTNKCNNHNNTHNKSAHILIIVTTNVLIDYIILDHR